MILFRPYHDTCTCIKYSFINEWASKLFNLITYLDTDTNIKYFVEVTTGTLIDDFTKIFKIFDK